MNLDFFKSLDVKYCYVGMTISGMMLLFIGLIFTNEKIIDIGLITFLYGMVFWFLMRGFEIKADIKLSPFKKRGPIFYFKLMFISFLIILISYVLIITYLIIK